MVQFPRVEQNFSSRRNYSLKIFDSRIAPILFCGAEIWDSEKRNQIEKYTYDSVLGVDQNAHSAAVNVNVR